MCPVEEKAKIDICELDQWVADFYSANFGLDSALIDYQASYKEDDKHEKMARVFIISCEMMNSLELPKLGEDIEKVLAMPPDGSPSPLGPTSTIFLTLKTAFSRQQA